RDGTQQIHHGRGIRASHAEVNQSDSIGSYVGHRSIYALDQTAVQRSEPFDVIVEVGQENIFSEFSKRRAGVTRQPVFHDVLFLFHSPWSHLEARNNTACQASGQSRSLSNVTHLDLPASRMRVAHCLCDVGREPGPLSNVREGG